jgi:molybdopterin converting factor small subunit
MFREAAEGASAVDIRDCRTVGECLKRLRAQFPLLGKMLFDEGDSVSGSLNVLINGQSVGEGSDVVDQPVRDGDEICPLMVIGGG